MICIWIWIWIPAEKPHFCAYHLDWLQLPRNIKNIFLSFDLDPHPSLASTLFF